MVTNTMLPNAPGDRSDERLIYEGNWLLGCKASLFCEYAKNGAEFADILKKMHLEYWGTEPEAAEVRSWERSLPEIASIMRSAGLKDQVVILEYCPPAQDKYPTRIDVIIGGTDENNVVNFALIELKQWTDFVPTLIPGMVNVRIGKEKLLRKHPRSQVEAYRRHMQRVLDACRIPQSYMRFNAYAYLHNVDGLSDAEKAILFNKEHHNDGDSKMYTKDFAGAFVKRLRERVGKSNPERVLDTLRDIQKKSAENRERLPVRVSFFRTRHQNWRVRVFRYLAKVILTFIAGAILITLALLALPN